MESNTQSEATLKQLGKMTVGDLITELERHLAETPVIFSNSEGDFEHILCISTVINENNVKVVVLS